MRRRFSGFALLTLSPLVIAACAESETAELNPRREPTTAPDGSVIFPAGTGDPETTSPEALTEGSLVYRRRCVVLDRESGDAVVAWPSGSRLSGPGDDTVTLPSGDRLPINGELRSFVGGEISLASEFIAQYGGLRECAASTDIDVVWLMGVSQDG